jgi:two-component system, OmpR family, phosphate regulon sensor histidine kinase PhoR
MSTRPSLTRTLVVTFAVTVVAVLTALAVVLDRNLAASFLDDLTASLIAQARVIRAEIAEPDDLLQDRVGDLGREANLRITIVRTDGVVLADSVRDPATMENHATRPEIRSARSGQIGVTSRVSETVGRPFRYVALPPRGEAVVRVALPLSIVESRLSRVRSIIVVGTGLAAVAGVAAVVLLARRLTRPVRDLTTAVASMSAGNLEARAPEEGPAEVALLARTLNTMAGDLEAHIQEMRRDRRHRDVILASMEEGIVLFDRTGRAAYANPAAARILGRPAVDVRSLAPHELRALVEEARTSDAPRQRELDVGLPTRTLAASAIPIEGTGDALLVVRDVSAARRVEAMRRDFVGDASHELKTPAAAIQAAAETAQRALEDGDTEAAARFAEDAHKEATRLSRIVADLLDLSRLESERPSMTPIRLDRVVEEEAERLRGQAVDAGVTMEVRVAPATVRGSERDLGLLIRNLVENAVRYTPSGGRIDLELSEDGERVVLTVSDSGIGIPTRDLPRVFERFYRVDRARSRETGGTGLGLSIARHVVERHGGGISARSELGAGSTFTVTLPHA